MGNSLGWLGKMQGAALKLGMRGKDQGVQQERLFVVND